MRKQLMGLALAAAVAGCSGGGGGRTITDNQDVGPGEVLVLDDQSRVEGNLTCSGGEIFITGSSAVEGNIDSTDCAVTIAGSSRLDGNINATGGDTEIDRSMVNGDINLIDNGDAVLTRNPSISGNVTITRALNAVVTDNILFGNLTVSGSELCIIEGNTVTGSTDVSGC